MDVLSEGDMRIHCQIRQKIFEEELQYMSPLQSWAPELRNIRLTLRLICFICFRAP